MNQSLRDTVEALVLHGRHARDEGDAALARRCFEQARQLAPDLPDITLDLGMACLGCNDFPEALRHAEATLRRRPDWRANMIGAQALKRLGKPDRQANFLSTAVADPQIPAEVRGAAFGELADLELNAFGDARSAAASLREAALANPAMALEARLGGLVADLYDGSSNPDDIANGFVDLAATLQSPPPPRHTARHFGSRLRIGLVSSQFCASPVGFLTLGALTALSKNADLLFFDRGSKTDWAHTAFREIAHRWLTCSGVDTGTLHRLMVAADLDVLIDLGGWTDPTALAAVAGRPARRQWKWVGGQAATTGLGCFDGFITDQRQTPLYGENLYTEPMLRARLGYVTYTAPPYAPELAIAAANIPVPAGKPAPGVYALVSNPAKISLGTAEAIRKLKPRRLLLVDQRWRHEGTRLAAQARLGDLLDVAEFVTPANHPEYLQALREIDGTFHDTTPYSMGLTAIELRLLGKHLLVPRRSSDTVMSERHCIGHKGAKGFDHHASLARQMLEWSRL